MFAAYFTTSVREIGEFGKLFVEPAGVADGVTVRVNVPLGVMTGGGGGCTKLELLTPLPVSTKLSGFISLYAAAPNTFAFKKSL
jgi:hypothetical protein